MSSWRIEPLAAWPYPGTVERQSSAVFRAGWDETLALLRDEAARAGAVEPVVLQLVCDHTDLRRDGMLRARAQVAHPGVIVTLVVDSAPLVFASDQYEDRGYSGLSSWQANVRAVALGLAALRAVDRYGITRTGEQYAGFRAIEAGNGHPFRSPAEARAWLATVTGLPPATPAAELYARAKRVLHPDARGGDRTDWDHATAAAALLAPRQTDSAAPGSRP